MLVDCDREMAQYTQAVDSRIDVEQNPLPPGPHPHRPRKNELRCAMREELYRLFGVDLTAVPGINTLTGFTVFSELGSEVSKFPSSPAFTAWLALCPNNQKSGDRVLSRKTRKTKSRINHALRVAAQSLHRSQSYLGAFYRRMRARLGAPKAITATAHKLARVLYFTCAGPSQSPLPRSRPNRRSIRSPDACPTRINTGSGWACDTAPNPAADAW